MRKVIDYPGNKIGPNAGDYVCNEESFLRGWDKYAETLGGLKDPATIFFITTFEKSCMDSELGFKLHAKVMIEEALGPQIDLFLEHMEEWVPKEEDPDPDITQEIKVQEIKVKSLSETVEEHRGGATAQEGDSIDDGEIVWVYKRGGWVPYWGDKRKRSGP